MNIPPNAKLALRLNANLAAKQVATIRKAEVGQDITFERAIITAMKCANMNIVFACKVDEIRQIGEGSWKQ